MSIRMNVAVVAMTAPSTHIVGRVRHTRNPYSRVRLTQMKWNGTVSHVGMSAMTARLARANATHAMSTQLSPFGHSNRSRRIDAISLSPDGPDELGSELGPEPSHVDVHHVRPGIELIPPYGGEQALLRDGASGVSKELLEQQELSIGQRNGPRAHVHLS